MKKNSDTSHKKRYSSYKDERDSERRESRNNERRHKRRTNKTDRTIEKDQTSKYRSKRYTPFASNRNTFQELRDELNKHEERKNIKQKKLKKEHDEYVRQIEEQVQKIETDEQTELREAELRRKRRMEMLAKKSGENSEDSLKTQKNKNSAISDSAELVSRKVEISKEVGQVGNDGKKEIKNGLFQKINKNDKNLEIDKENTDAQQKMKEKKQEKINAEQRSEAVDIFDLSDDDQIQIENSANFANLGNIEQLEKNAKFDKSEIRASEAIGDCDDSEGFLVFRTGDIFNNRYKVLGYQGKGVFSSVFLVQDMIENEKRSIKIIRNVDVMHKTGLKELQILRALQKKDPENKKHCVFFYDSFEHKNHLCIVFEALSLNLRQLLRKCGSVGLNILAVRSYAAQLLVSLAFLRKGELVHADIKPDNILVNEKRNTVKICDFGSAFNTRNCSVTPYLCSRYYRPPEIVLGCEYLFPVDMWSFGCVLFELYAGKILFKGETNNAMIFLFLEMLGRFPNKLLKKGAFVSEHFDDNGAFLYTKVDSVTRLEFQTPMHITSPRKDLLKEMHPSTSQQFEELSDAEKKNVRLLKDLIEKCLRIDPVKRITPAQALLHPFIVGPVCN